LGEVPKYGEIQRSEVKAQGHLLPFVVVEPTGMLVYDIRCNCISDRFGVKSRMTSWKIRTRMLGRGTFREC
jgi:hypothetical protein